MYRGIAYGMANALTDYRDTVPLPGQSRRRCSCGCGTRAALMLRAAGAAMGVGCEMHAARWVRDPRKAWATARRLNQATPQEDEK